MADATLLITLSPGSAYSTKRNILFPGNQTRATAQATAADTRIEDALPSGATVAGLTVTSDGEA